MLRKTVVLAVALASLAGGCKGKEGSTTAGAEKKTSAEDQFKTEDEKVIYAFGAMLGTRFAAPLQLTPSELEMLKKGISDTAGGGQPAFPVDTYGPKLDALVKTRAASRAGGEKTKSQAFLDQAAQEQGAVKTPSGMVFSGHSGHRPEPRRHGHGARPLSGHADGRQGVRQLDQARPARRVPAQRRDPVLDRGRAADEGRREGEAGLPVGHRLRRQRRPPDDPRRRHPGVRGGAPGDQGQVSREDPRVPGQGGARPFGVPGAPRARSPTRSRRRWKRPRSWACPSS